MRPIRLTLEQWQAAETAHTARADSLTAGHVARRGTGRKHPVEDFLFEYYNYSPAKLRRWHPGPGVILEHASGMPRAGWRFYRSHSDGSVSLDVNTLVAQRGRTIEFVHNLLSATLTRPPFTGCFGLHEWAMVYRLAPEQIRHAAHPLRLSPGETDRVVEQHTIRCSHFDAFRFFTPDAISRNTIQPSRDRQVELEQPGCLHAGMDVYKWAHKLDPLIPSEMMLAAFELALRIRTLDMQASPYDLRDLGYAPVAIETPAGKATYAAAQRAFAEETNALRRSLLTILDAAREAAPYTPTQASGDPSR